MDIWVALTVAQPHGWWRPLPGRYNIFQPANHSCQVGWKEVTNWREGLWKAHLQRDETMRTIWDINLLHCAGGSWWARGWCWNNASQPGRNVPVEWCRCYNVCSFHLFLCGERGESKSTTFHHSWAANTAFVSQDTADSTGINNRSCREIRPGFAWIIYIFFHLWSSPSAFISNSSFKYTVGTRDLRDWANSPCNLAK